MPGVPVGLMYFHDAHSVMMPLPITQNTTAEMNTLYAVQRH
jgi:hypothetical protein